MAKDENQKHAAGLSHANTGMGKTTAGYRESGHAPRVRSDFAIGSGEPGGLNGEPPGGLRSCVAQAKRWMLMVK